MLIPTTQVSVWLKLSGNRPALKPKYLASESYFGLRFRKQIVTFIKINSKLLKLLQGIHDASRMRIYTK